jgi:hypothetical protein
VLFVPAVEAHRTALLRPTSGSVTGPVSGSLSASDGGDHVTAQTSARPSWASTSASRRWST